MSFYFSNKANKAWNLKTIEGTPISEKMDREQQFDEVIENVERNKRELFMLTEEQQINIYNEVVKIIKSDKCNIKVYGGYAQNFMIFKQIIIRYFLYIRSRRFYIPSFINVSTESALVASIKDVLNHLDIKDERTTEFIRFIKRNIKHINLKDCFYPIDLNFKTEYALKEPHDLDVYSSHPLALAEKIYKKCREMGYESTCIIEAIHHGTYSVRIRNPDNSTFNVCDLTYVPTTFYSDIPYDEINGMLMVKDKWVLLDFYKMFSDPVCSSFRYKTVYDERLTPFEKYFNFAHKQEQINHVFNPIDQQVKDIMEEFKYNDSVVVSGYKAYNIFLSYIPKELKPPYFQYLKDHYYEFISIDYDNDNLKLQKILDDNKIEYTTQRRQRFCYYKDYTTEYYINGNLFCIIYANNNISIPYLECNDGKETRKYKYTCHTYTIYHFIAKMMFDICVLKDKTNQNNYYIIISHLLEMRDIFYEKYKINEFSPSPFQFITYTTIGKPITNFKSTFYKYKHFKFDGSKDQSVLSEMVKSWTYINISGNVIKPPKSEADKSSD